MANKKTLIERVADKRYITEDESKEIVNDVLDSVWELLLEEKLLSIYGFGSFNLYITKGRVIRSPRDQSIIEVPDRLNVSFDIGMAKKDMLYDRAAKKPTPLGQKIMSDIRVVVSESESKKSDKKEKAEKVVAKKTEETVLPPLPKARKTTRKKIQRQQLNKMQERIEKAPIRPKWVEESKVVKAGRPKGSKNKNTTENE